MQRPSNATTYQIPRYLGFKSIHRLTDGYRVQLGYAQSNAVDLELDHEGFELLMACQQPATADELVDRLKSRPEVVAEGLRILKEAKVVTEKPVVPENMHRYDRHLLFYQLQGLDPLVAQAKISQATVALIGVGGIGNWTALALIGAGFKEIRLIDFDTIELSNLTRQVLFKEDDLGNAKIAVASRELAARNHETKIVPIDMKVSSAQELSDRLRDVDFVILSADRPAEIHDWVDQVCVEQGIPYLNLGYRDHEGVVGPLTVPGETSCYQCFKKKQTDGTLSKTEEPRIEPRYQAPSFGPVNALVSAFGANEVIKYLVGLHAESKDTELAIDPITFAIQKTKYHRDVNCWHCSDKC